MALPNPTMSFSPFAILTAEEMNNLVENIESLADGSGFNAGAIGTSDIAAGAVTFAKTSGIWWEELGRTKLVANASSVTVNLSSSRKNLRILVTTVAQSGQTVRQGLTFNGDNSTNYASRVSTNGGADALNVSQINITLDPAAGGSTIFSDVLATIREGTGGYWVVEWASVDGASGLSSAAPNRRIGVGKWVKQTGGVPDPITSVVLLPTGGSGIFGPQTEIIVLGHD